MKKTIFHSTYINIQYTFTAYAQTQSTSLPSHYHPIVCLQDLCCTILVNTRQDDLADVIRRFALYRTTHHKP